MLNEAGDRERRESADHVKKERDGSEGNKRAELERVEVIVKELLNKAGDREREREHERK